MNEFGSSSVGEFVSNNDAAEELEALSNKEILKLLLGDEYKERPHESELLHDFLAGRNLAQIEKQPNVLAEEGKKLREDTENLVYDNYSTFLQTSVAISKTKKSVNETKVHLGSLLQDLPNVASSCENFAQKSQDSSQQRAVNRLTMQHYPQLLELLEVPQLLENCVRGRHYEKALELQQFARRTLTAHPNIAVLQEIVKDTMRSTELMREQIQSQLSSECDMETTIKAVEYLRRLESDPDELELRKRFLACREVWMDAGSAALPQSQTGRWLTHCAERLRTDLFYIVTQYQTLFAGEVIGSSHVLFSFAFRKVNEFIALLQERVPLALHEGEEIGNVFDQTMYAGSALSRVGLDFRVLLHPIFERCVLDMFKRRTSNAVHFFGEALRAHDWQLDSSAVDSFSEMQQSEQSSVSPPSSLMKHAPLAVLLNDMLDSLNHLRYCAFRSLTEVLRTTLKTALQAAGVTLKDWTKHIPKDTKQYAVFTDMYKEMTDSLVPHVQACFDTLFANALNNDDATVRASEK